MHPVLPVSVLLISSIGWGLTWWPLKQLGQAGLSGLWLVMIAFGTAALLMTPVLVLQRNGWRRQASQILLIALFGGFANLAFQVSLHEGDVIRVMILFYLLPVWSVLGGWWFLGEGIDPLRIATVIGALAGAFLILGGPSVLTGGIDWLDLLAIGSGLAFAMNNIVFRATPGLPLFSKVAAMFWGCSLLTGGYLVAGSGGAPQVAGNALLWTALYGVGWLTLITFGTQWAVTRLEAGRASILIIVELVVAVVSAAILLNETLSMVESFGAALVVGAAMVETFRESAAARTPAADYP